MKKINKKVLIFMLVVIGMVALTGCQRNVDSTGATLPEKIIYLSTPWSNAMSEGFLSAILVWPLAQAINLVYSVIHNSVFSIILVTLLFTIITLPLTIKSTVATQKMQMLQPKMNEIQAKYEGKTDDNSKMRQAQEMQELYAKYNINPIGSMLTPFLQFPILIAMYYAVQRADAVVNGTFAGFSMSTSPKTALGNIGTMWPILVVFVLMIVVQLISTKLPQWLAKKSKEKSKDYRKYQDTGSANNMQTNMMMISMVAMVGLIGFSWPIAMSVYWLINSLLNALKTVYIQMRYVDNE